jgi:hypothetical protein
MRASCDFNGFTAKVGVMGYFEAAFLCAVALVMITAIQMDN